MPTYAFTCKECDTRVLVLRPMREHAVPQMCSLCGTEMVRDFREELPNIGDRVYQKPIISSSLAINPSQIPEHRRLFPDIKMHPEGMPIFESAKQHDKYLDRIGAVKHRQKTRRRGKKTTTTRGV